MRVTFDEVTNPETVREVEAEHLAAVFGEGVRLQAVTEGRVEGVLGWMPDYSEAPIIPKVAPMDVCLTATLRQGVFIRRNGAMKRKPAK